MGRCIRAPATARTILKIVHPHVATRAPHADESTGPGSCTVSAHCYALVRLPAAVDLRNQGALLKAAFVDRNCSAGPRGSKSMNPAPMLPVSVGSSSCLRVPDMLGRPLDATAVPTRLPFCHHTDGMGLGRTGRSVAHWVGVPPSAAADIEVADSVMIPGDGCAGPCQAPQGYYNAEESRDRREQKNAALNCTVPGRHPGTWPSSSTSSERPRRLIVVSTCRRSSPPPAMTNEPAFPAKLGECLDGECRHLARITARPRATGVPLVAAGVGDPVARQTLGGVERQVAETSACVRCS